LESIVLRIAQLQFTPSVFIYAANTQSNLTGSSCYYFNVITIKEVTSILKQMTL